ncbi:MAG: hypothetical protein NTW66_02450 [Candidatus Magasanikbacteria bacterium]|nr:hypothetical protein [Candidatus Magasanikbacteria bacterium]
MSEFAKVNPGDISPKQEKEPETVLSPKDNARLINILKRAKAAEADEDTMLAIRLYEEYLEEFEKIKRDGPSPETPSDPNIIIATNPEGKEVSINLESTLLNSKYLYAINNLTKFSDALPETITLSESSLARCREALEQGFDKAIFFPNLEVQLEKVGITKLKQELADKPLPKGTFPDEKDNYSRESYLQNPIAENHSLTESAQAKRKNGYLLFYSSNPVPKETKNLTFPEAVQYLKDKNLDGLTLPEYYILQRKEAEINEDHSFDAYNDDADQSNSTWLIDSRAPGGCVRAVWNPDDRRVVVYWSGAGNQYSDLGARPAIVVPLEL